MTVKQLLFFINLVILVSLVENKLILEHVIILNRHSLRAPLSNNLKDLSSKAWPKWDYKSGFLTAKGARLAGYMGSYFAAWLKQEGILQAMCPSEDDLSVFANSLERTLTSAQSFLSRGFPDCKINIRHTGNVSDPLFNPIIHNTSAIFRKQVLHEIYDGLEAVQLNEAYEVLSDILDYKQSRSCTIYKKCNLAKGKNFISIKPGFRPQLSGPLKIGNDAVDAFLVQNYEGFPTEDVAWGQLTDPNVWQKVIQLKRAYFNVTYKTSLVARDISEPLIKLMSDVFFNDDKKPKVTFLFGHDVNIHTIFQTLLVRPYTLENQIEIIPIGSAAVFQKWRDDESKKTYFKLSFVYQSTEQLRCGNILSLETPPHVKILELEKCSIDKNGYCPWDDFKTILRNL